MSHTLWCMVLSVLLRPADTGDMSSIQLLRSSHSSANMRHLVLTRLTVWRWDTRNTSVPLRPLLSAILNISFNVVMDDSFFIYIDGGRLSEKRKAGAERN